MLIDKETLERLIIVDKISYEEIGRQFNCTGANIKKRAKKLGIALPVKRQLNESEHYNKGKRLIGEKYCLSCGKALKARRRKYCAGKCQHEFDTKIKIENWKNGTWSGTTGFTPSIKIRNYLFAKYSSKCQECGWGEVNKHTNKVPLQVHHIDGNSCNNVEKNLQLLCPNCHSLTHNWGKRNKNAPEGKSKYFSTK